MYLGSDFNSIPVVGSDRVTTGLSPVTMHVDPVSGLPETMAASPGTTVIVQSAAPVASGGVPWMLLALAGVAYYGYREGWFTELLGEVGL